MLRKIGKVQAERTQDTFESKALFKETTTTRRITCLHERHIVYSVLPFSFLISKRAVVYSIRLHVANRETRVVASWVG